MCSETQGGEGSCGQEKGQGEGPRCQTEPHQLKKWKGPGLAAAQTLGGSPSYGSTGSVGRIWVPKNGKL